jgi:hypothetical protein
VVRPYSGFGFEVELALAGSFFFLAAFLWGLEPDDADAEGVLSFWE